VGLDTSSGNPFGPAPNRDTAYTPLVSFGRTASKGQFPWLVALWFYKNGFPSAFCGGVLVAPDAVVTAAHCLFGQTNQEVLATRVLVGAYNSDFNDCDCEERRIKVRLESVI
jgi:secreted trypsin-like serine protease